MFHASFFCCEYSFIEARFFTYVSLNINFLYFTNNGNAIGKIWAKFQLTAYGMNGEAGMTVVKLVEMVHRADLDNLLVLCLEV